MGNEKGKKGGLKETDLDSTAKVFSSGDSSKPAQGCKQRAVPRGQMVGSNLKLGRNVLHLLKTAQPPLGEGLRTVWYSLSV